MRLTVLKQTAKGLPDACSTRSRRTPSGAGILISALERKPRKRLDPRESPALVQNVPPKQTPESLPLPNRSERRFVLLPGSDAGPRRRTRNSTQISVDRVKVPIRHVPIIWPWHYSQSTVVNRIDAGANNFLELF